MEEFDSTFKDNELHVWNVKITTKIAMQFAGQNNIRLEELIPDYLNAEQLIKIAWMGIQHHADAKNFDYDDFLDLLEGEAITSATQAASMALINFTLRRVSEKNRVILHARIQKRLDEEKEKNAEIAESGTTEPTVE